MATTDDHSADGSENVDLDRLVGDLEWEAARRRADPAFPHDEEARLHAQLERQGPHPSSWLEMRTLVADVEELAARAWPAPPAAVATGPTHRLAARFRRRHSPPVDDRVATVAVAVCSVLRAALDRLEDLQGRVRLLEQRGEAHALPPAVEGPGLAAWRHRLAEPLLPPAGRVLYAELDADAVVAMLRTAGIDAYGLTRAGSPYRSGPDVRYGDVLHHLEAVDDGALAGVVLAGPPDALDPPALVSLTRQLGRTAATVEIVSEAPWHWQSRQGVVDADLSTARPLSPDTWLSALAGAGLVGSAEYDATGSTYRVVARRPS